MELFEIKKQLDENREKIASFQKNLDLERLEEEIAMLENDMAAPGFWDDNIAAQKVINESNELKAKYDTFMDLQNSFDELEVMYEMVVEEPDASMQEELEEGLATLNSKMQSYELEMLLNQPYDHMNAIIEIHPGAGGTESQDWGSMLMRMYERWGNAHNFKVEIVEYQDGDEAGIKSVTIKFIGHNAYGFLRSEMGVHRLVRISPFDSAKRRHTSFCSVEVLPELDDSIDVEINSDDLKVDTYRASGAGGQHINKTESAVRITHIPTGTVVASQTQRSQLKNREEAMGMLKSKLYTLEMQKKQAEVDELKGDQKEIGWGSQIRSYVFHPYNMVKDHRTNYETGAIQAVMDGDIDGFIDAYLKWSM